MSELSSIFGAPLRAPESIRRTPEVGLLDARYVTQWVRGANWEPGSPAIGEPAAPGLALNASVQTALGAEAATLAAEFAAVHAPGQDVFVVPADNGTRIITVVMTALAKHARALGLREPKVGDNVIVPALTWQATAGALLDRGLAPRLADVDPGTLCLDPEAVRGLIDDRTVAIVPVHLYNRMAPMAELVGIANPLGIAVVEDCAHAHGARYWGQAAGTLGIASTFSLQGSKVLACGEGGLAMTTSQLLADQICSVVTCGRLVGEAVTLQGGNDRMPGVAAALARAQLTRFPEQNALRNQTFRELDRVVRGIEGAWPLEGQREVDVQPTYKFPVQFDLDSFGLSLAQLRASYEYLLGAEFVPTYQPLTNSPYYQPHSDPARRLSDEYWAEIDPRRYPSPAADEAYRSVLAIEHAAGLDPDFPAHFAEATGLIRRHSRRIARAIGA